MQRAPCSRSSPTGRASEELVEVVRALRRIPLGDAAPLDLQERPELAHQEPFSPTASSERSAGEPGGAPLLAARAASSSSSSSRSTRL